MTIEQHDSHIIRSTADIPDFASEDEEREFWQTHEMGMEMFEGSVLPPGLPLPQPAGGTIAVNIRFDRDMLNRIRAEAKQRHLGYQTYIKQIIVEHLAKIDAAASGSSRFLSAEAGLLAHARAGVVPPPSFPTGVTVIDTRINPFIATQSSPSARHENEAELRKRVEAAVAGLRRASNASRTETARSRRVA